MGALVVRSLSKRFGGFEALKNINLDVENGEFVVLVGASGSGKSTLLSIIAGLETHSGGAIEIGGRNAARMASRDRDIAMVFQSYALYPSMTVRQNITFGMRCRGVPRREQRAAVARVAELLQIGSLLERRPSQLSGGQRQRVAIGRALVRDPVLFLFDEPLSNLDAKLRVQMRMEIKELHQRIGKTTLYVTHDQIEAMTLATRVAVMHQGEIQQFDRPDVVYNRPANLFVANFMGSPAMNTMPARLARNGAGMVAVIGEGRPDAAELPLPPGRVLESWEGRNVILGIRPECVTEFRGGASPVLNAFVTMTETTGPETIAMLKLGGQSMLGKLSPDAAIGVGETGAFEIDTRKLSLFDPETQKLIERQS